MVDVVAAPSTLVAIIMVVGVVAACHHFCRGSGSGGGDCAINTGRRRHPGGNY